MSDIVRIGYVPEDTRWTATVAYEVDDGELRRVTHHVMELEELHDLIEIGPTFCSIRSFTIEYCGPKETIKEAMSK